MRGVRGGSGSITQETEIVEGSSRLVSDREGSAARERAGKQPVRNDGCSWDALPFQGVGREDGAGADGWSLSPCHRILFFRGGYSMTA